MSTLSVIRQPGTKPLCSFEMISLRITLNLFAIVLEHSLYKTLHKEIGRYCDSSCGLLTFGIKTSSVLFRGGSKVPTIQKNQHDTDHTWFDKLPIGLEETCIEAIFPWSFTWHHLEEGPLHFLFSVGPIQNRHQFRWNPLRNMIWIKCILSGEYVLEKGTGQLFP